MYFTKLDECKRVKCDGPSVFPYTEVNRDDSPVDFGGKVEYRCVSGYMFKEDPELDHFVSNCQNDGSYNLTDSKACFKGDATVKIVSI